MVWKAAPRFGYNKAHTMPSEGAYKAPEEETTTFFFINNAAELAQFKDLLKMKVNIFTLVVHRPEGLDPINNHYVPMVVKRNDKMLTSS